MKRKSKQHYRVFPGVLRRMVSRAQVLRKYGAWGLDEADVIEAQDRGLAIELWDTADGLVWRATAGTVVRHGFRREFSNGAQWVLELRHWECRRYAEGPGPAVRQLRLGGVS